MAIYIMYKIYPVRGWKNGPNPINLVPDAKYLPIVHCHVEKNILEENVLLIWN